MVRISGSIIIITKDTDGESELFKDVFNNVHLIEGDSSYQLYYFKDSVNITLLYPTSKEYFFNLMEPILAGFDGKLVYKDNFSMGEKAIIYYLEEGSSTPKLLTIIFDSLEYQRKMWERISQWGMWVELKKSRYWKRGTKLSSIYEGKINTPIFSVGDSLIVVNCYKDSLLVYDENGSLVNKLKISFHKDLKLGDIDYKNWGFIVDPVTKRTFVLERKTSSYSLRPFIINTGNVGQSVSLPKYGGMTNIRLFNNKFYFLYDEKSFPHYVRLFQGSLI